MRWLFEGGEECLPSEVFGMADVARETGHAGYDAGRPDAPDGFDGTVVIGGGHC